MVDQPKDDKILDEKPAGRGKLLAFRIIGISLLVLAFLLAIYGVVAYSAWQRGQSISAENETKALDSELQNQFTLADQDISNGNFSIAIRRLEWILAQDNTYPGASNLLDEAQRNQSILLTPSPVPRPTVTPTVEIEPTESAATGEFSAIEDFFNEALWSESISAILAFQAEFPNYRRQETNQMLFTSYIQLGEELLNGQQVESGLYYLGQAEKLGNLPIEIEDQRTWAEIYLLGIGYYGVDWETSIYYFRDLCAAAPFFQDACSRLFDALVEYGEQFATSLDWCPANELFKEALTLERDEELRSRASLAFDECLLATPTPTATLENQPLVEETPTPGSE